MANQRNSNSTEDPRRTQDARPAKQPGQQQAYSNQQGQQGTAGQDNRLFSEHTRRPEAGVEKSKRSLADRERDEADSGAPDDVLPDRKPPGWTTRDV